MTDYSDIINLPHHTSEKHPRMDMTARAAQFSPFAALTGFGDVIDESGRETDSMVNLTEEARYDLDARFRYLNAHLADRYGIKVRYFVKDARKSGGKYCSVDGYITKINIDKRVIEMNTGTGISMDDIVSVEFLDCHESYPD